MITFGAVDPSDTVKEPQRKDSKDRAAPGEGQTGLLLLL